MRLWVLTCGIALVCLWPSTTWAQNNSEAQPELTPTPSESGTNPNGEADAARSEIVRARVSDSTHAHSGLSRLERELGLARLQEEYDQVSDVAPAVLIVAGLTIGVGGLVLGGLAHATCPETACNSPQTAYYVVAAGGGVIAVVGFVYLAMNSHERSRLTAEMNRLREPSVSVDVASLPGGAMAVATLTF